MGRIGDKMKISELSKYKEFKIVQANYQDQQVTTGYTSDLLSDVMANAPEGSLLITIQAHTNTVAVATLVNSSGILICNDRDIPEDMVRAAAKEKLALLKTGLDQYQASVMLSQALD